MFREQTKLENEGRLIEAGFVGFAHKADPLLDNARREQARLAFFGGVMHLLSLIDGAPPGDVDDLMAVVMHELDGFNRALAQRHGVAFPERTQY